jgi:RNA polymerase sigma-70 factor (ECF subfamily)
MRITKLKGWAAAAVLTASVAAVVGLTPARAVTPSAAPALVVAQAANLPAQAGKSVQDAPPVVVKTVPEAGTDDVDPGLKEIKVTFSKPMADESWSWSTAPDNGDFPTIPDGAKISYQKDKKTCVLPVKLEPGKTYAIWVNSQQFVNFKDADGRSAVPYLLVFATKNKKKS